MFFSLFKRLFSRINKVLYLTLICIFLFTVESRCEIPQAKNGIIDLRAWDFKTQGKVSLEGEWRFDWESFKDPSTPKYFSETSSRFLIKFPGPWNNYLEEGEIFSGHGYATFSLRILTGKQANRLSLSIKEIHTSYTLFVNGKQVERVGKVGKSRDTTTPEYRPTIVDLPQGLEVLDLVIHVANYHHRLGGPRYGIIIGTETDLRNAASNRMAANLFMIGSIFMISVYHFCLFILRRSYFPSLYLGIFCLLITIRSLVTNERYLHLMLPNLSWEILLKLEYLSFYLAVPVFASFIASLFPKEFHPFVLKCIKWVALVFSVLVVILPGSLYSHTIHYYQLITLISSIYLFYVFYKAVRKKREGIMAVILGFVFLFISIVNDILVANGILNTSLFLQAGMFIFIFSQAFILSLRFSNTYQKVETQSEELKVMNRSLSKEIFIKEQLEKSLLESHEQFMNSRIGLILGLAKLAEYRDKDTGSHLERIREFVRMIAIDLSNTDKYAAYITPEYIEDIYQSSILHDIGKIGIRDSILLKPGKLSYKDFEIMKTHAIIGGDAITEVAAKVGVRSFLTLGKDIAYYHHEKWNGTGYPKGLSGEEIPLSARITAIADVYDALTTKRPYKPAFSHQKAMEIIIKDKGIHFDPDIVEAFWRQEEKFKLVNENFRLETGLDLRVAA